jgi:hypothetical protein
MPPSIIPAIIAKRSIKEIPNFLVKTGKTGKAGNGNDALRPIHNVIESQHTATQPIIAALAEVMIARTNRVNDYAGRLDKFIEQERE